jgi:ABC-type lipoprotein export system ATPase subunit
MIQLTDVKPIPLVSQGMNPRSAVFGTQCTMAQGAHYLITAPSGKGKSTLLHILYGLRSDYEGEVQVDDLNLRTASADQKALLRQKTLAIVFQDLRLFPELSALDNIRLKAELTGYRSAADIEHMAEQLGVASLLHQKAGTLSYGQQQRIAIIRALQQPFRYLLLDEPFSHLDPDNTARALSLVEAVCRQEGASMMLTSLAPSQIGVIDRIMEL